MNKFIYPCLMLYNYPHANHQSANLHICLSCCYIRTPMVECQNDDRGSTCKSLGRNALIGLWSHKTLGLLFHWVITDHYAYFDHFLTSYNIVTQFCFFCFALKSHQLLTKLARLTAFKSQLIPGNYMGKCSFLDKISELICHCLLPRVGAERLAQSYPIRFVPKAGF